MSEHTKGRLKLLAPRWTGDNEAALIICNEAGSSLGIMSPGDPFIGIDESQANARRLVACWNACDGVSTESLESVIPGASILDTQFAESKLERGRAELMAVCEREAAMPCRCAAPHSQCISCAARAAIAKAREVK